jgi:diaminopimelate decarboxylase
LGPPPDDLGALDPAIWPIGARREAGVLQLGGVDVTTIAQRHGSPSYVVVEDDFRARCRGYRDAFGPDDDIY